MTLTKATKRVVKKTSGRVDKMTYARARLWLGVSCVGTLVLFSLYALIIELPTATFSSQATPLLTFLKEITLFSMGLFLIIAPFDLSVVLLFQKSTIVMHQEIYGDFYLPTLEESQFKQYFFCLVPHF